MSINLNIAIIQSNLVWENPVENRNRFTEKIIAIKKVVDMIVLPEMFSTGFSMTPKHLAETMNGETVLWMQEMALEYNTAIVGSMIVLENNCYYNRLLFVKPDSSIEFYDKRHAFTLAGEDKEYTAGKNHLIVDYRGWRICPLICYDLRFPVWSRNTQNYDLLIYVANWPKPRINAWNTLLKARAIENMSYCIGVNRVGTDANNYEYSGNSIILDPLGKPLTQICEHEEKIMFASLDKDALLKTRDKLQFLTDQDTFVIK